MRAKTSASRNAVVAAGTDPRLDVSALIPIGRRGPEEREEIEELIGGAPRHNLISIKVLGNGG
jgi:hypothetical protein